LNTYENPNDGWNLFARVLQEVLVARGLSLGHLDDRVKIHPEKVRRLQRSLKVPKSFPVLNIDEMDQVVSVFHLNRKERVRLRAALLATAIEETLMDRINQNDALLAAEQILPIIEQALQTYADDVIGIGAVKGEREGSTMLGDAEIERELGGALAAIDRATLALHLSLNTEAHVERVERARLARDGFESALVLLETVEPAFKASEAWHVWHDEARRGQHAAKQRLADLGA
jgi:hypothetical protein